MMRFRDDIQGLRAIAVLSVFIFHLNPTWLPGGFIGVDVFFVISGFLISSICLDKIEKREFSFFDFYKSRIRRIVPAYFVVLFVTAIACFFIYIPYDLFLTKGAYISSLAFLSNVQLPNLYTYFGVASTENPFLHTWTLAVEMQFYAYLPFLLFFIKSKKRLLIVISSITIILFVYGTINVLGIHKNAMYFSLLARSPEFMIGVLASILYKKWNGIKLIQRYSWAINIISLVVLVFCFFRINEKSDFPGIFSAIPCLATAFLLLSPKTFVSTISNKLFLFVGNISYSLYLWHWPVMAFTRYYYDVSTFSTKQILFVVSLSFMLAIISYFLVENPLKKINPKLFWSFIIVLFGLNIVCIYRFYDNKDEAPFSMPDFYWKPSFGLKSHSQEFEFVETMGDTLVNHPQILLTGDSHAYTMKYYFDLLGKKYHFSFNTISNDGYPPVSNIDRSEFKNDFLYEKYQRLSQYAKPYVETSDIIILTMTLDKGWGIEFIEDFVNKLKPDQTLIFLSDYPELDKNPIRINKSYIKDLTLDQHYEIKNLDAKKIIRIITSHPNCYYLDLSQEKTFADAPFYKDTLMYYDQNHISQYGQKIYFDNTNEEAWVLLDSIFQKY